MVKVKDIAALLNATAYGNTELDVVRPSEPVNARRDDLALAMTPSYGEALGISAARVAIIWPGADWRAMGLDAAIEVPRARLAMARLTQAFDTGPRESGIHPSAVIDATAKIGDGVSIGPFSVIGADAKVGDGCWIGSHVSIATGAQIGAGGLIHAGVRIGSRVRIGDHVILQPNVVIGADGFSFVTEEPANEERALRTMGREPLAPPRDAKRHRIHSLGGVVIGKHVEVGAGSTLDAGTIRATRIGDGTKIDNLVQIGHNVIIGDDCVLCAQAAVAGSAILGDRVVMGGKSGIKDNISVGADVVLGGAAIVLTSVGDGVFMMGYPAVPMPAFRAQQKALRQKAVSNSGHND